MKLSQLSTEALAQVLLRLTPPLCRILRDEATLAALDAITFTGLEDQPPLLVLSQLWEGLAPTLLDTHAQDVYQALSILTDKPVDTLRQQPGATTLQDILSIWDEQLIHFFSCAGSAEQARS